MNISDLAEVISDLSNSDLAMVFRIIPKDKAVEVFSEFDVVVATNLLRELSEKETVSLIPEGSCTITADNPCSVPIASSVNSMYLFIACTTE